MANGTRLKALRQASGLTQAELAARAGVSRQLVAAVEAGQNTPAVDAALGLARALGTTVEALFAALPDAVTPVLGTAIAAGTPVRLGRVGERLVAAPLPDHGTAGAGWAVPDGVYDDGALHLLPAGRPAGLVLAGCDPALGIAEAMLAGHGSRSLLAVPSPTGDALAALADGRVHAAVVHGPADRLPPPPVPVVRWHLARWSVGLGLAPALPARSLEAVLGSGTPIVQRDPAAASQQALTSASLAAGAGAPPAGPLASGHLDAARLAATLGTAGVTMEAAAHAFGLRFLALEHHTVEVWLAPQWAEHPAALALGELLMGAAFQARVAPFGGYDLTGCGRVESA